MDSRYVEADPRCLQKSPDAEVRITKERHRYTACPGAHFDAAYGETFGMTFRFRTQDGDAPVLRLLWRKKGGAWRITSYEVELP